GGPGGPGLRRGGRFGARGGVPFAGGGRGAFGGRAAFGGGIPRGGGTPGGGVPFGGRAPFSGGAPGGGGAFGRPGGGFPGGRAGGIFGGDTAGLNQALAYARSHGGGTIGIESQSGASQWILSSNANVAGLGGFSGRESTVTARWIAMEVRSGRLSWLFGSSSSQAFGAAGDGRQGSRAAIATAERVARKITLSDGVTLYDLRGRAAAILAAAGSA
ncbi:MAG TPA: hypothetical protein VMU66_03105, partial [Gaiellales bacterium]|nr:hypothetical protein [Gaiellales bacterium]